MNVPNKMEHWDLSTFHLDTSVGGSVVLLPTGTRSQTMSSMSDGQTQWCRE
jgi:hypothetical protein